MGTKSNDYIDVAFCTKFFENDKFLGTKSNIYIDVTFCTQILVKIYKFLGTKSTNTMKILFRSCCSDGAKYINASGHGIPELLAAILEFFPLDTYVFNPVTLMDMVNADKKKDMKVNKMNR